MPNSTIYVDDSSSKRFLDYNIDGCIELSRGINDFAQKVESPNEDLKQTSILAKFHDTTFNNNVHIDNKENFTLGRISKKALVLAANNSTERYFLNYSSGKKFVTL